MSAEMAALDSQARVCFTGGMATNECEERARVRKAVAIATILERAGVSAADAADISDVSWLVAAKAANVNSASEQTRQVVITILQERERLANTDPFAGLPR